MSTLELWLISCRQSPIFQLPLVLSRRKGDIRRPLSNYITDLAKCGENVASGNFIYPQVFHVNIQFWLVDLQMIYT